ncbi:hypothetical protein [Undibacterium sp. SXout20W]|uniref:hypothetical protein n=1 Tax=Undibacterium sp. SXout20W TaxID=3413051 RepID=UPI003BF42FEA
MNVLFFAISGTITSAKMAAIRTGYPILVRQEQIQSFNYMYTLCTAMGEQPIYTGSLETKKALPMAEPFCRIGLRLALNYFKT